MTALPSPSTLHEQVCSLYEAGDSLRDIGEIVGLSHEGVRRILTECGVPLRGRGFRGVRITPPRPATVSPVDATPKPKAPRAHVSPWTPERAALVKQVFVDEGASAAQTAKRLGPGFSRSAVIGFARRQGWTRSAEAAAQNMRRNGAAFHQRAPKAPRETKPLRILPTVDVPTPGIIRPPTIFVEPTAADAVPLIELKPSMCRWPIGDPGEAGFGFCGRACAGSYCASHQRRACVPTPSARDLTRALRRYT